jgi:hypothetical protein
VTAQNSKIALIAATLMAADAGCSNSPTGPVYDPVIPTDFSATVDNPLFPLVPGTTWTYTTQTAAGLETNTVEVLAPTRVVNGVDTREVHDQVFLNGSLTEDTYDWYAQDGTGNVWYLGEDSKELDNGVVVSTEGSWEWGMHNALPGIIMAADPAAQVGVAYRQEYQKGVAEDWGKVIALNQSVTVPYGSLNGCTLTEDWSALDSGPHEQKTYCPGIGVVLEVAGTERSELISVAP